MIWELNQSLEQDHAYKVIELIVFVSHFYHNNILLFTLMCLKRSKSAFYWIFCSSKSCIIRLRPLRNSFCFKFSFVELRVTATRCSWDSQLRAQPRTHSASLRISHTPRVGIINTSPVFSSLLLFSKATWLKNSQNFRKEAWPESPQHHRLVL